MSASRPKGSAAVMASRLPSEDKLDYFPTPPWATRALIKHVINPADFTLGSVWEPACGAGDMARPLAEYFDRVDASDVVDRGYGRVADFLWPDSFPRFPVHWIITNPPFALAEEFVLRALRLASVGVAMLARTNFFESEGRYRSIFGHPNRRLAIYAPFAERVPMVKGRLDPKASTATAYAWFVWEAASLQSIDPPTVKVIPPCRRQLERPGDYQGGQP
jgi:hypothetical protein